jgi:sporulation protein YlmC with PRC-barrel domain
MGQGHRIMLLKTEDLMIYTVDFSVNIKGKIFDIYFDSLFWNFQYLLITLKISRKEKIYLIPTIALEKPDINFCSIPIQANIIDSNDMGEASKSTIRGRTIQENDIQNSVPIAEVPSSINDLNSRNVKEVKDLVTLTLLDEKNNKVPLINHIRSYNELLGYHIRTNDDEVIGHVTDFIVESETWKVRYFLIETRNWLTGGKKILLSPTWIEKIRWSNNVVSIDLTKEAIVKSPAYNPDDQLDDHLEIKLFKFYSQEHFSS